MANPVFYDPRRSRWKRLRRLFDVLGVAVTLIVAFFIYTALRGENLPELLLPTPKRPYRALKERERRKPVAHRNPRRKSKKAPSQVKLNTEEGIRAAFYVNWDPASFSSLREYAHQIDLLFPEWLHVLTPDGHLQSVTSENQVFDVIRNNAVRSVDDKVMPFLNAEDTDMEVFPMVNNFDTLKNDWQDVSAFLNDPQARATFRQQLDLFLASDRYRGLMVDFEAFPLAGQKGYKALLHELSDDLHAKNLKLYVSVPTRNEDYDYAYIASQVDGVVLMNYDQHFPGGTPGPVAGQAWFTKNLKSMLKAIPREKVLCAIGNYGYDWTAAKPGQPAVARNVSVEEAWLGVQESEADLEFDSDSLNPHYAYLDEDDKRHDVWFLDGVTALNQMRAAETLGINTFALWRLGSEDRSMWAVWDVPGDPGAPDRLRTVPPGQDVDMEGKGEILRIEKQPSVGKRNFTLDESTGIITDQNFISMPNPYQVAEYGARPKMVAITFDDGPDPQWTPKMLDVLKAKQAPATFFLIGMQAEKNPALLDRIYREGHEIGNHTFTHPDISGISRQFMKLELNLTERLFASRIGVKPLLFRPPYSIDQEPDTADQVKPLEITQDMGYITVGDKIDPNDWRDHPRNSAEQITASVMAQLGNGNIILLHDGGGNRAETVKALPMIIDGVRARGYQVVPVAQLLGKQVVDVMPPISANERWAARLDRLGFWMYGLLRNFIVFVFFVGDVLMTGRLVFVGLAAIVDRLRDRQFGSRLEQSLYRPKVAVIIPAYNEEKVIERTVRAVLDSEYPDLHVIVVDDGSSDRTLEVARKAFANEINAGWVQVLTKPNSGKAEALNYGLRFVEQEIFVGIDADTVIAPDAIGRLVPHFLDPKVGAVAGNAKVGNRVNLWTRWQALEYITSQNFERRALDIFGAVSVVPGAIGAWRTAAVKEAGGYHIDTVAEDADLTMALLELGYRVQYEDRALAYTEAPMNANGLMRQRFRWSFGILQSVWKHRSAFAREGVLGWIALPNIVIFQILLPLVSPFIDIMFALGSISYLIDRYFHPGTADSSSFTRLVLYFAAFLVIDFIASTIAFALERRDPGRQEDIWLLSQVWLQRFAYRQLFSVVLFKTLKRAVEGQRFAWDKLERTAALPYAGAAKS
jgi:peptidoglycan-N-acetylglucosamine deacetylase